MQHDYNGFPNQANAAALANLFPGSTQLIRHNGHLLLLPIFSATGLALQPSPEAELVNAPQDAPVIRDLNSTWDIRRHATARRPVSLGVVNADIRQSFVQPLAPWCSHVLDMPIKFPHTDVRVPDALSNVIPAIRRVIDIEYQLNPNYSEYYAYMSVHQAVLQPGERMRENPHHVDGFQGPRWETKHPVNHSYLLADQLATVFYPRSFPLDDIDPNFDDIYAEFTRVIEGDPTTSEWRAKDWELILIDAYCVHRGDVATVPMVRTWMRISWETRIFDRLGNTHNPLFDYHWDMVARDTDPRIRPRQQRLAS